MTTAETIVIEPIRGWRQLRLGEVWAHRELLYFLVRRDLRVRYAQAVIGFAWAVLQPLLMMLVFTIFLGKLAKVPSDGVPYPVFSLAGLLPWTLFASSVSSASDSLVGSTNLISKVYFPRLTIPLAAAAVPIVDFLASLVPLAVVMAIYDTAPAATVFLLPFFVLLAFLAAAGVGTLLSALNVAYRDVRYAIPFVIQLWLFATPVVYPASLVPARWQWVVGINPMAGVVEGFRWALLGTGRPTLALLSTSLVVIALLLSFGVIYFRRVEHHFADVI